MAQDRIRYEVLVQDALRNVIRKVLADIAEAGLLGEHHFFITFFTNTSGVGISPRLKERYPEQMTIVLQHQFWDLRVNEDYFEVTLSFGDIPEKLTVPFAAVQVFYDPAAAFEAAFDMPGSTDSNKHVTKMVIADNPAAQRTRTSLESQPPADVIQQADGEKPLADIVSLDAFRKNK